jgi:hypothetical protein
MKSLESIEQNEVNTHEQVKRTESELEQIAEIRHFNEKFKDDLDRVNEDEKEEEKIRDTVNHFKENGEERKVYFGNLDQIKSVSLRTRRIITNVTDFVPIIGSVKMIIEGIRGKQYGTEKEINGMARALHTGAGTIFLGLDMTGVGIIASEIGKGALKFGERVAVRKLEQKIARDAIKKEGEKLLVRGEERIDRKEEMRDMV